jgi:hypothetical protein
VEFSRNLSSLSETYVTYGTVDYELKCLVYIGALLAMSVLQDEIIESGCF